MNTRGGQGGREEERGRGTGNVKQVTDFTSPTAITQVIFMNEDTTKILLVMMVERQPECNALTTH